MGKEVLLWVCLFVFAVSAMLLTLSVFLNSGFAAALGASLACVGVVVLLSFMIKLTIEDFRLHGGKGWLFLIIFSAVMMGAVIALSIKIITDF